VVKTDIFDVGGWPQLGAGQSIFDKIPYLKSSDVSLTVQSVLTLPYNVNVSQMIVHPVGEKL
jgi:NADP-dependent 3-hydroxy acid dehydrogenase YdfG